MALTLAELRQARTQAEAKVDVLDALVAAGLTSAYSWETGSVPSALVETEADELAELDAARVAEVEGGLNELASGDALDALSEQVYANARLPGRRLRGRVLLTDVAGAGPFTFSPSSVTVTVGAGGLAYAGVEGASLTLPKLGTVLVVVDAAEEWSVYNVSPGAINFFARGALPGVSVTNQSDWIAWSGAQTGADAESDESLRTRNRTKWATLGGGSPQAAYENWARQASVEVTRAKAITNRDLLDPGRVDLVVAGVAGAVGPDVVMAVQDYIAPAQIGGERIPVTARCVVSSALNRVIVVSGTIYVQAERNDAAFQAQVATDLAAFAAATAVGGPRVSWERVLGVVTRQAGLDPGIITDVENFQPSADVELEFNEVPVFDVSALQFSSVG